jgi:hypothetical protein
MAKESGIAMSIAVDDSGGSARTISNDITDFSLNTPRNVQVITGLDKSAEERLQLLADFSCTINGVFDDASNMAHAVFATVPSSSVARTVTITVSGQSLPNETFFNDYALTRAASGELTWSAPGTLSGGTVPTWA